MAENVVEAAITDVDSVYHFLSERKQAMDAGKLAVASWQHYLRTAKLILDTFGRRTAVESLSPGDFTKLYLKIANYRLHTINGIVNRTRTIFKHMSAYDLIDRPVKFGPRFVQPAANEIRAERTTKLVTADQILSLLTAATGNLRAMILLGINCGFGQTDCSELPCSALSREEWVVFPRPKTGIDRRCPLWPETIQALNESLAKRPQPKDETDVPLMFVNNFGRRYVRYSIGKHGAVGTRTDGIGQEYRKLCKALGIPNGFYRLRHTFRTVADGVKDGPACDVIMGHITPGMASTDREDVDDDRLESVIAHVRKWLKLDSIAAAV